MRSTGRDSQVVNNTPSLRQSTTRPSLLVQNSSFSESKRTADMREFIFCWVSSTGLAIRLPGGEREDSDPNVLWINDSANLASGSRNDNFNSYLWEGSKGPFRQSSEGISWIIKKGPLSLEGFRERQDPPPTSGVEWITCKRKRRRWRKVHQERMTIKEVSETWFGTRSRQQWERRDRAEVSNVSERRKKRLQVRFSKSKKFKYSAFQNEQVRRCSQGCKGELRCLVFLPSCVLQFCEIFLKSACSRFRQ